MYYLSLDVNMCFRAHPCEEMVIHVTSVTEESPALSPYGSSFEKPLSDTTTASNAPTVGATGYTQKGMEVIWIWSSGFKIINK